MPKRLPRLIAAAAAVQFQTVLAQYEQLPTLVVEGDIMQPGTVSLGTTIGWMRPTS